MNSILSQILALTKCDQKEDNTFFFVLIVEGEIPLEISVSKYTIISVLYNK